jgi:hypothetical protein
MVHGKGLCLLDWQPEFDLWSPHAKRKRTVSPWLVWCLCVYMCMHECVCVCVCTCACMNVCVCVCVWERERERERERFLKESKYWKISLNSLVTSRDINVKRRKRCLALESLLPCGKPLFLFPVLRRGEEGIECMEDWARGSGLSDKHKLV